MNILASDAAPGNLFDLITESCDYLRSAGIGNVDGTIILGSGLGDVSKQFEPIVRIDYSSIPHLPDVSVEGHNGELVYAKGGEKRILVFSGRIHYYEGHPAWLVAYPLRLAAGLGSRFCITTAAAGGLNTNFREGMIVMVTDHINFLPSNPLRGPNDPRLGPRFPDMSNAYDHSIQATLAKCAGELGIDLATGVYSSLPGPSLETIAEYVHLHRIGADLVGMSMVAEAIAAAHAGLPFGGLSVVSNLCYPPGIVGTTTVQQVIDAVSASAPTVAALIGRAVDTL